MSALLREVQDLVNMVFQRYPTLCGFSVREDMSFSNLACYPAIAGDEAELLCEELSAALAELLDERPEIAELLRGRTLARTFH
ncbi:MAG TPA: hypothetical protein VJ690_00740 [Burkholderiales bacterium]|jgi:hypothetical protein|nr:hypothetical protein [Burkholderiales bacterium]